MRNVVRRPDAAADPGRRAWVDCPRCADASRCPPCVDRRACDDHWRYLLTAARRHLFLQCPACLHRWWHDTDFGRDDRPSHLDEVAVIPPLPGTAA